jgi:eukaryotic-like serine/threonine-protein kinase
MAISVGEKLGPYEILSAIGAGGMGEVYKARDTRLDRVVALKLLPDAFLRDRERMVRFEREARVLASLNHPGIAALYGFEQNDGIPFLVMEYVPGETLSGPMPADDAITIARQIAEALEAAHESGIVHRDLKPANIKLTPEGRVKILDFGLAKALENPMAENARSQLVTLTAPATESGVIMGTPAYMSPEQAKGKSVDRRADIWAFGCVLYELLAGQRAFKGDSQADTIAGVLSREPDWNALAADIPVRTRQLLRRCLKKDPHDRLRDIGDARLELTELLTDAPAATERRQRSTILGTLAAVIAVVALAVLALVWRRMDSPLVRPVTRTVITLSPGERLAVDLFPALALSPDARRLVYVATKDGRRQIYNRPLDRFEATPIPGTEGGVSPFFSPDGQQIGFLADGKLKTLTLNGGLPTTLVDLGDLRGASWGSDGSIVLTPSGAMGEGLSRLAVTGRALRSIKPPDINRPQKTERWPDLLPGGRAALFSEYGSESVEQAPIGLAMLDSGERRMLRVTGSSPRYATPGYLLYGRGGDLLVAPFEITNLEISGESVSLENAVMTDAQTSAVQFSVAGDTLAYIPGGIRMPERSVLLVDRRGETRSLLEARRPYLYPRLSPDGTRLAFGISEGSNRHVWIYDLNRKTTNRLTFGGGNSLTPVWSPDGKRVVFISDRGSGMQNLYWTQSSGGASEERLTTSLLSQNPASWSPDGKWLLYQELDPNTSYDIWVLPVSGSSPSERKPRPWLRGPYAERQPQFSPDGKWVAYTSNETGRYEVFVQAFDPAAGGKRQISTEGGMEPTWSRNGRELFYRNVGRMMVVDVSTKPSFAHGSPKLLFEGHYFMGPSVANYDVTADGQHFVMLQPVDSSTGSTQIHIVQNWQAGLKR